MAWEYQRQFVEDPRLAGVVIISQGPSDLTQPDWPNGMVAPLELGTYLEAAQTDFRGFFADFVREMFKTLPSEAEQAAMVDAICGIDPNAGAVILADQTLRDLRPIIPSLALPHLLVWGTDEGVIKQASGTWLAENLPSSELHVFEDSGHCPMWEEPERFNALVAGLGRRAQPLSRPATASWYSGTSIRNESWPHGDSTSWWRHVGAERLELLRDDHASARCRSASRELKETSR